MNHDHYRQWLMLSLYGELDPFQQETLDIHLRECDACRAEMQELKDLQSIISKRSELRVDEKLLQDARRQFRIALVAERSRRRFFDILSETLPFRINRTLGVAVSGAALFALGLLAGYTFLSPGVSPERSLSEAMIEQAASLESGTQIANVRFADGVNREGMLDLTFDAVVPLHLKGNMNDPRIQRILASALMNSQNPGVRFQTANMLASRRVSAVPYDVDVKDALITALETDENPGVRKEALAGLLKFPFDDQIKRAYMRVLMKDKNSGMRIDVINALTRAQSEGVALDADVISVLQHKQQTDENEYIRTRATTLLEGVHQ